MLSARDQQRLIGVHPDLIRVVTRAAELCPFNFGVSEGVRTLARQKELYAKGRTAPGKKVTDTMNSRHLTGHAVDLVPPSVNGQIDWNDKKSFLTIGKCMFTASQELSIPVRWGWDWDGDKILQERGEYDGPHFELLKSKYP